jgi:hypothetical protein
MDQDGILTGSIFNSKSGQNGVATAQIYVGDSADNLTLLAQASCTSISNYNDYANMGNNLCLPIKRNKYFKITIDNKRAGFVIDHYFYFTSLAING